jgi:octaprenyl-diphosphate synthase
MQEPAGQGPGAAAGLGEALAMTAAQAILADPSSRYDRARALVAADMAAVNALILERMQSEIALIPELARHLIAAGGKRVRPTLTLLCARLCGHAGQRHIGLATAVEFIHTATLLHDDVVDDSELRRGRDTANAIWGNKSAVLVGDFLFARAFQLMVADGSLRTLGILADASAVIAEGEVAQLVTANDTETGEDAYLRVITAKTAALFRAACEVGAVVAARPESEAAALASYGEALGIAFQLVDDALDYAAAEARLGKHVGDDFREGKITLPVILAFRAGDEAERRFWRRTLAELEQAPGDLAEAQRLLARHGAIAATLERARGYGARARAALMGFRDCRERTALLDIIDFCIERAG